MSAFDDRADNERPVAVEVTAGADDCVSQEEMHSPDDISVEVPPEVVVFPENIEQFQKTIQAFKDAEKFLKKSELLDTKNNKLYIPSVNELRYYGYHINKAFSAANVKDQFEELRRAERHCHRAAYDAVELGMIYSLKEITSFHTNYNDDVVTDVIPSYPELLTEVETIRQFIVDNSSEDRSAYYNDCFDRLMRLKQILHMLLMSQSSLNAKRMRRWERSRSVRLGWLVALVVGICSGVAGAVAADYLNGSARQESNSVSPEVAETPKTSAPESNKK